MTDFLFKITADSDHSHEIRNQKMIASWPGSDDKPGQCVEKQRHGSADKVHIVKAVVFPVVTYGEGRMPKN